MARRGSVDSVQTWDTRESKKKKKKISIRPHSAESLFQEQRKDSALRKLIKKGKTSNMTVKKVHGKSIVFFFDKVYIPKSLREETMNYYVDKYKKKKLTPIVHMEENCFWEDMHTDLRSYENEKEGQHFGINITYRKLAVYH